MAFANKLTIEISWENGTGFEVIAQFNSDASFNVVGADENGEIKLLWPHYQTAIDAWVDKKLTKIGDELKAEV